MHTFEIRRNKGGYAFEEQKRIKKRIVLVVLVKKRIFLRSVLELTQPLQYLRLLLPTPFEGERLDLMIVFEANLESFHIAVITSPLYA